MKGDDMRKVAHPSLAAFLDELEKVAIDGGDVAAGGAIAVGAGAAGGVGTRGRLLGYQRVYHGTQKPGAVSAIKQEGLRSSMGGTGASVSASANLASSGGYTFEEASKGRTHVTPSKTVARAYSGENRVVRAIKSVLGKPHTVGSTVSADVPMEVWSRFKRDPDGAPPGTGRSIAVKGKADIAPELIRESPKYKRVAVLDRLKGVPAYARRHPGRFGAGLVGTAGGAAMIGAGAHHLMQKTAHPSLGAFLDELEKIAEESTAANVVARTAEITADAMAMGTAASIPIAVLAHKREDPAQLEKYITSLAKKEGVPLSSVKVSRDAQSALGVVLGLGRSSSAELVEHGEGPIAEVMAKIESAANKPVALHELGHAKHLMAGTGAHAPIQPNFLDKAMFRVLGGNVNGPAWLMLGKNYDPDVYPITRPLARIGKEVAADAFMVKHLAKTEGVGAAVRGMLTASPGLMTHTMAALLPVAVVASPFVVMAHRQRAKQVNDELEKFAESGPIRDFAAGIDPTGTKTFKYGLTNKEKHRSHAALGVAGGFIGGATVVPSAVLSLVSGLEGAIITPGGVRQRARGAAHGAWVGFKKPVLGTINALRAQRMVANVAKTGSYTQTEANKALLAGVAGEAPLGSLGGLLPGLKGHAERLNITVEQVSDTARKIQGPMRAAERIVGNTSSRDAAALRDGARAAKKLLENATAAGMGDLRLAVPDMADVTAAVRGLRAAHSVSGTSGKEISGLLRELDALGKAAGSDKLKEGMRMVETAATFTEKPDYKLMQKLLNIKTGETVSIPGEYLPAVGALSGIAAQQVAKGVAILSLGGAINSLSASMQYKHARETAEKHGIN